MIKISSVNVGVERSLQVGKRQITTGIRKIALDTQVYVGELGLQADVICDARFHGGADQAVYIYREEDYLWWSEQYGQSFTAGLFGENLTLAGIPTASLMVGDRIQFDSVQLEITAPRIPCSTLAANMAVEKKGDAGFLKAFIQAARPGFYCRVINEGSIMVGEAGELVPTLAKSISTVEFFRDLQQSIKMEKIRQYLRLPIDIRSRQAFEKRLR
ncbi:MAG: MOSC domain-containing protein [Pseudomonadales bacterium]|nr:MOSC domain-containing protein [Pseudomonadales bacterium]